MPIKSNQSYPETIYDVSQSTAIVSSSARDVLDFLTRYNIINVDDVQQIMTNQKREKLLQTVHPYSIYQYNGKWCTYLSDDSRASKRRRVLRKEKAELLDYLFEHYQLSDPEDNAKKCTLRTLYPDWLEYKRLHTTAISYILRISSDWTTYYENTKIVDIPLRKLDKITLDKWAHELIQKYNMTKVKYYNVTVIMRQALLYAVDLKILKESPFSEVKIDGKRLFRKVKKKPDYMQVFSDQECKEIADMAWDDFHNHVKTTYPLSPLALLFQLQTGIRIGELCALKYEDLETPDSIHIQRMVRRDTKEVVDHTKTDCGDRQVLLTSFAKYLIQTAREYQKALHVQSDYIFSVNNQPLTERCIASLYTKYTKHTDSGIHKPSHTARRTFISSLLDAQMSINSVRQYAGHSDERTTLQNYVFDRTDKAARLQKFEDAVGMKFQ